MATWSEERLANLTPDQLSLATQLAQRYYDDLPIWSPLEGPQTLAFNSTADIVGYGGAAGGGKTDLAIGRMLRKQRRAIAFRKNGTEHTAFVDRLEEILGTRDGFNGKDGIWRTRVKGRKIQVELGSVPNDGDEKKYRGRPHDFKFFDEASEIPEHQVRFLLGWLRTTDTQQQCQALLCFNPPTSALGRWVIKFFAPWLDPSHPCPALPGELRYFAMIDGEETEMLDKRPFVVIKGKPVFDFNAKLFKKTDIVTPLSRTFIPARVTDNPYLVGTYYMSQLQALPEPLRSQMLNGDFLAGVEEDPWQVCPTAWVEAAMARWSRPAQLTEMLNVGVDVARGGKDETVIARKHKPLWFDEPLAYAGAQTPNGPLTAGLVMAAARDQSPLSVEVNGVGASPYDFLVQAQQPVYPVDVSMASTATDYSGMLSFFNVRSELWWKMREALDPARNTGICLPPHPRLKADLCTPRWKPDGKVIQVESREEIIKRLKRSADYGTAYILALPEIPKVEHITGMRDQQQRPYDPYSNI